MSGTGVLRIVLAGWLLAAACRLGGPSPWSAPPEAGTAGAPGAADAPVGAGGPEGGLTSAQEGGAPGAGPVVVADGPGAAATVPADAGAQDASGDAAVAAGAGCSPPFAAEVCDPVCNTGCPPLSRCDVSPLPRQGACVGIFVVGEGALCFRGDTTDSCAVRLTCLDGRCRRLCYRDADCTAGSCCSHPLAAAGAPSGFAVCAPCDPPPPQQRAVGGKDPRGATPSAPGR
jgi:hypothetical protein